MNLLLGDIKKKKQLGQYFSGSLVSNLLAELSNFESAHSIIDPMCGIGDMLLACKPETKNKKFVGVEFDEGVYNKSINRLDYNNVQLINQNVFDCKTIKNISTNQYDLVITNPPYVRYQTISENKLTIPGSLSTPEIKENLKKSLNYFVHLDDEDKKLLSCIISNYSGLSDLAVPSWILCALLCKVGGKIAMVVPQTWLNREYANIIQYLLLRWFKIEYIIEDGNSKWFPKAQVKTTLLIAQRIDRKESIFSWNKESFKYCTILSSAITKNSLVGKIAPDALNAEKTFADILNMKNPSNGLFHVRDIKLIDFARNIKSHEKKWFITLEPQNNNSKTTQQLKVPSYLQSWLKKKISFDSFQDIGISISQGLRTGANGFFYLEAVENIKNGVKAIPSKYFDQNSIFIPKKCYKKVIRKQSDLTEEYSLDKNKSKGIVLSLQKQAIFKDIKSFNSSADNPYSIVPKDLETHIKKSTQINISKDDKVPKYIPELSAVRPNIKKWDGKKPNNPPKFWYMLPPFTKRHSPDLFVPRVNSNNPKTRINNDNKYIIDANFSSFWISDNKSSFNNYSLLALLNSSWCVVAMEEYGTVMGGGALKLEANQLKTIPIPKLSPNSISTLSILGKKLCSEIKDFDIIKQIDEVMLLSLGYTNNLKQESNKLFSLRTKLLKQRNN